MFLKSTKTAATVKSHIGNIFSSEIEEYRDYQADKYSIVWVISKSLIHGCRCVYFSVETALRACYRRSGDTDEHGM